jgi:Tol biopolymer transport system component
VRFKNSQAPRRFSGIVAGGAVLVGVTALFASMALEKQTPAVASQDRTIRVTVDEGTNISISRPTNGRSIIMDLHGFLYRLPGDGGRAKRITSIDLDAARPEISPNGQQIAFQSYDAENGGYFHVKLVNPDGSGVRRLTSGNYDHREPAWSRDGRRVAFASDRPTGQFRPPLQDAALGSYNIWSMDVATGTMKLWADTVTAEEGEPTWSPDGTEIAYVVSNRVEAVNEAGARRTIIPQRSGLTINSPSWAPTGTDIAYIGSSGMESDLWVGNHQITSGQDVFRFSRPQWISASEIMYAADGKIRIIDVNSGVHRDVAFSAVLEMPAISYKKKKHDFDAKGPQQALGIVTPMLSPDGGHVVFQALNDLWDMEIGRKPRRLTKDSFYEVEPAWSPDGRHLAYSSDKAGTQDIYVRDMITGSERRVTSLQGAEVAAAWSPDGKTIAFQNEEFETWTVNVNTGELRQVLAALFAPGRPSWSPDGNTIALAARMRYSTRFREGHNQILTVNLTTGEQKYYPPGGQFSTIQTRGNDGPAWSPDGKWMAVVLESTLHVIPVDNVGKPTGAPVKINNHATDSVSWSGDSEWLLYESNGDLKMVSRDGSRRRSVPLDLTYRNAEGDGRQVIHAGKFWDAKSSRVRTNVDIEVIGNRIKSITPHAGPSGGDDVIDASNLFVMPGLWDTHFHREREIRFFGDRTNRAQLAYGMTSTLAPGDVAYNSVENREAVTAGTRVGPRGFASGEPIDGARTHLDHFRGISNLAQLPIEESRMRGLDYDYLKTYVRTSAEVKRRMGDAAHKFGIPVGTHLMSPGFYVGVDGTAHLSATQRLGYARTVTDNAGMSYEDVPAVYANRSIMTTLGEFDVLSNHVCPGTDPRLNIFANWKLPQCDTPPEPDPDCMSEMCRHTRTMARMRDAGSLVLAGTDFPLGSDVMLQLHAELRTLAFYGHWSPYQALLTATRNPAEFLGIDDDLGTLEPGKLADMIFVQGNPLENIDDTINVEMTMVNGILRTVEEIIAPFPSTGNQAGLDNASTGNQASLDNAPKHVLLPPVPDHPANAKYWWARPKFVKDDFDSMES